LAAGGIAAVSAVFAGVMLWSPPAMSSPEGPVSQVAPPSAAVAGNRVFWTNTSSFGTDGLVKCTSFVLSAAPATSGKAVTTQ
jgi:hypothetical protein